MLWTARNGATISGHVWATRAGPQQRPGVVITNGSVQADEQMYWYAAQTLAKAGYVVLTWDPQGQGQSDVPGEGPDASEGVPGQSDGRPFYVGQWDPRVKAIVAWDNLGPADPAAGGRLGERPCPADPDPLARSAQSLAYSRAGVDTGQLVIRGGTHYECSFIANAAFGATLRGADLTAWYTTAWFDRYVKGDPSADARLLTTGWLDAFSFYYRSRLDIGGFTCEDLRGGCPGIVPGEVDYSYLSLATSPDAGMG